MICPHCRQKLKQDLLQRKILFRCPGCGGQYLTMSALRGLCRSKELPNRLWSLARGSQQDGVTCPGCGKAMRQINLPVSASAMLELDVCLSCQSIFFDTEELNRIPLNVEEKTLAPEVQKAVAACAIYHVRETAQMENSVRFDYWSILPALLGLPVEENNHQLKTIPFVTWGLAALCLLTFILSLKLSAIVPEWGFIPSEMFRKSGITWLSSMFLHGSWEHIFGNLYFLLIFGDNVEDEFDHGKYFLLVLVCGLVATLTHGLCNLRSTVPCIGASGFISGIIACYAICFPKRRIIVNYFRFFWKLYPLTLPAWGAFLLWFLWQSLLAYLTRDQNSGTAYTAHIGGAFAGAVAAFFYRWKCSRKKTFPALYENINYLKQRQKNETET